MCANRPVLCMRLNGIGRSCPRAFKPGCGRATSAARIEFSRALPAAVTWMSQSRHAFVNDECFHASVTTPEGATPGKSSHSVRLTAAAPEGRARPSRPRRARSRSTSGVRARASPCRRRGRRASTSRRRRSGTARPSGCCTSLGDLRDRRDRPHPGVHRQGGGADLLQQGRPRRGDAGEDVGRRSCGPATTSAASIWQPVSEIPKFGIWPLILGTLKVTLVAMAGRRCRSASARRSTCRSTRAPRTREIVKPVVELLAGIPSVVLGLLRADGDGDLVPERASTSSRGSTRWCPAWRCRSRSSR